MKTTKIKNTLFTLAIAGLVQTFLHSAEATKKQIETKVSIQENQPKISQRTVRSFDQVHTAINDLKLDKTKILVVSDRDETIIDQPNINQTKFTLKEPSILNFLEICEERSWDFVVCTAPMYSETYHKNLRAILNITSKNRLLDLGEHELTGEFPPPHWDPYKTVYFKKPKLKDGIIYCGVPWSELVSKGTAISGLIKLAKTKNKHFETLIFVDDNKTVCEEVEKAAQHNSFYGINEVLICKMEPN